MTVVSAKIPPYSAAQANVLVANFLMCPLPRRAVCPALRKAWAVEAVGRRERRARRRRGAGSITPRTGMHALRPTPRRHGPRARRVVRRRRRGSAAGRGEQFQALPGLVDAAVGQRIGT